MGKLLPNGSNIKISQHFGVTGARILVQIENYISVCADGQLGAVVTCR